jgi:hypothetical protein
MTSLLANDNLSAFLDAYKKEDSSLACRIGREIYRSGLQDEKILIAIGKSCAEDDYINFIGVLQQRLGESVESRRAAVYLSTLILQKRLISQYMFEDIDFSAYTLPKTEHVLSLTFEAIKNNNYTLLSQSPKHLRIGDKDNYLDLYVGKKIHIDVYRDREKIQEHRYRK